MGTTLKAAALRTLQHLRYATALHRVGGRHEEPPQRPMMATRSAPPRRDGVTENEFLPDSVPPRRRGEEDHKTRSPHGAQRLHWFDVASNRPLLRAIHSLRLPDSRDA